MHAYGTEALPPPSGQGSVMIDVGGSRGALIVFTSESMLGVEIELRQRGRAWAGTHTAVRRRDLRDAVAFAGVFGSIPEGQYELRVLGADGGPTGDGAELEAVVVGGEITQIQWPGGTATPP